MRETSIENQHVKKCHRYSHDIWLFVWPNLKKEHTQTLDKKILINKEHSCPSKLQQHSWNTTTFSNLTRTGRGSSGNHNNSKINWKWAQKLGGNELLKCGGTLIFYGIFIHLIELDHWWKEQTTSIARITYPNATTWGHKGPEVLQSINTLTNKVSLPTPKQVQLDSFLALVQSCTFTL